MPVGQAVTPIMFANFVSSSASNRDAAGWSPDCDTPRSRRGGGSRGPISPSAPSEKAVARRAHSSSASFCEDGVNDAGDHGVAGADGALDGDRGGAACTAPSPSTKMAPRAPIETATRSIPRRRRSRAASTTAGSPSSGRPTSSVSSSMLGLTTSGPASIACAKRGAAGVEDDLAPARLQQRRQVAVGRRRQARRQAAGENEPLGVLPGQFLDHRDHRIEIVRPGGDAGKVDVGDLMPDVVDDLDVHPGAAGNADEPVDQCPSRRTGGRRARYCRRPAGR